MRVATRWIAIIGLALAVVGCGGASSPAPADGSPAAPTGTSGAEPSQGGATPPASGGEPSIDGGTGVGVCDLVTAAELATMFGVPAVTTEVLVGPPDTCDIEIDGAPAAAVVLMKTDRAMGLDAAVAFAAYATASDSEPVAGIGDQAVYSESTALLIFIKGDSVVSIAAFNDQWSADERRDFQEQMASTAASRL
jgi:hypothetical protein